MTTPAQVTLEGGSAARAVAVTCGQNFSCALMATGEVQCWGSNASGQLGRIEPWLSGSSPPSTLSSGWNAGFNATGERVRCGSCGNNAYLNRVTQISAGTAAACARLVSGEIRCWGRNPRANGGTTRTGTNEDTRILGCGCGRDPRFCGCGNGATDFCASGSGSPTNDQITLNVLPHAGRLNANFSSHVSGGAYIPPTCSDSSGLDPIISVSVHNDGGCVITASNRVHCWGSDGNGRRGDTSTVAVTQLLMDVAPDNSADGTQGVLRDIVAVNGGDETKCALRADGRAFCWGANALDQASGTVSGDQVNAVRVITNSTGSTLLKNAISVTAGRDQSCAMTEGWVRCWGDRTGNSTFTGGPAAVVITPL